MRFLVRRVSRVGLRLFLALGWLGLCIGMRIGRIVMGGFARMLLGFLGVGGVLGRGFLLAFVRL